MQIISLPEVISFCKQNQRVCPQPQKWNTLFGKLKNKKQIGSGWEPALPLILAAWWESPSISKQVRFFEHINWAAKYGQLQDIYEYL